MGKQISKKHGFSEPGGVDLNVQESIRPEAEEEVICGMCGEQEIYGMESEADDEAEEAIKGKRVKSVYFLSQQEREDHELTHLPFGTGVHIVCREKGVSTAHKKRKTAEAQVPAMSTDYMGLSKREPDEGVNPLIVLIDNKTKMKYANVVQNTGDGKESCAT